MDIAAWEAVVQKDPLALARQLLEQNPSEQTRAAIEKSLSGARPRQVSGLVAGLTLGSPEFQKR
jgi:hypothetical protein